MSRKRRRNRQRVAPGAGPRSSRGSGLVTRVNTANFLGYNDTQPARGVAVAFLMRCLTCMADFSFSDHLAGLPMKCERCHNSMVPVLESPQAAPAAVSTPEAMPPVEAPAAIKLFCPSCG